MNKHIINIDLETRSFVDLPKYGAWRYSEDKSADVLCMAYKEYDDEQIHVWLPGDPVPEIFKDKKIKYVARYSLFEYAMFANVMIKKYKFPKRMLKPENWICTRALSLCAGLPGSLKKSAKALNLAEQKDEKGMYLINKYSKPQKDRKTGALFFNEMNDTDMGLMIDYCVQDVRTDAAAYKIIAPLPNAELERDIFLLDFKQNVHGLPVDTKSLKTVLAYLEEKRLEAEALAVKYDVNPRSGPQVIAFFKSKGYIIANCQKKTIERAQREITDPDVLNIIHLRLFLSKASVKKFNSLDKQTSIDKRIRYTIRYYGAHTGRFSGSGFQPHNLPKTGTSEKEINGLIKRFSKITEYPEIIESAKKILPGLIKADPGKHFLIGDFAAIEARGIAYLAGENKLLDQFQRGEDVYKTMASVVFKTPVARITKKQRQLGKQIILACGYGMGVETFKTTCDNYNMDVSDALAEHSVKTYRATYNKIKSFWYDLESAFLMAYNGRKTKKAVKVGKYLTVIGENSYIKIRLPSGRFLYYHRAQANGSGPSYYNYQQDRRVKLWGGLLAENVVQAMCRDILVHCMLELDKSSLDPLMHVHDEIVCYTDRKTKTKDLKVFNTIMNTAPEWLPGFPLLTESETSGRYHK